jgi:hypothetical protein
VRAASSSVERLPLAIGRERAAERPTERIVSVDGAWDAPGLNLSHWPGNRTPPALRHALSTGSALEFALLSAAQRERLAADCVAVANNHYDTDGCAALFAVLRPEHALRREHELLAAAAAGDFFEWPSDQALAIDAIVSGLADPVLSPLAGELERLPEAGRLERAAREALEILPRLLAGELAPYAALWEPDLERARADRALLERSRVELAAGSHLAIVTVDEPSTPPIGRHALFGTLHVDRVLVIARAERGHTFRLIVGTRSWFDAPGLERLVRPDLRALASALDALAPVEPGELGELGAPRAWRAEDPASPSPELWFGGAAAPHFAEHGAELEPSALDPERVAATVRAALAG